MLFKAYFAEANKLPCSYPRCPYVFHWHARCAFLGVFDMHDRIKSLYLRACYQFALDVIFWGRIFESTACLATNAPRYIALRDAVHLLLDNDAKKGEKP